MVGYNNDYDLALIKISDNNGTPLPLISPSVDIGQKIFAIGNPLGLEGTISDGIISGLRDLGDFSVLQISAPISPGNSGGPVVNENGDVVGVATFTISEGQNINFAVPVKYLKELLENQISQVSLASIVKTKTTASKAETSKDFNGIKFTKFYIYDYGRRIEFSIKNNLRKDISDIKTIWIVYDDDGEPVDYTSNSHRSLIKAKLARRVDWYLPVDAINYIRRKGLIGEHPNYHGFWDYVEFRVLDFKVLE